MRLHKHNIASLIWLFLLFSCKERYFPDIAGRPSSYLVVEGVLNTNGSTIIRLSRTTQLDTSILLPEMGAQVQVEDDNNIVASLPSIGEGRYSAVMSLNANAEYRLRIFTNNGKEYLSEKIKIKDTPAIDSIGWHLGAEGLQLYVNTEDPTGNTRYYKWEFEETWEVRALHTSRYIYENGIIRERESPAEDVHHGWSHNNSSSILLGSSASLAKDVIFKFPLVFIPLYNEKPAIRYSMLLRQYSLDQKGYEFYKLMKKNTESLGTIFDAQPSEMQGNIKCLSNPSETVIGYLSACAVQEKRVFINRNDLPSWRYNSNCDYIEVPAIPDSIHYFFGTLGVWVIDAIVDINNKPVKYTGSSLACIDVRSRGASLIRPPYW